MALLKFLRSMSEFVKSPIFTMNPNSFRPYSHRHNAVEFSFSSQSDYCTVPYGWVSDVKIAEEAEKICKFVLNSRNLDSALCSSDLAEDLSPKLVHEVLKKLNNAGTMALGFFRWAEKQKGFQHSADCYNSIIDSIGKIRQFKTVWQLVDEMQSKNILCSDTFALIFRRLARAGKPEAAIAAFQAMENQYGFNPQLQDYNKLLDALSKSQHVQSAHQVFDEWKNKRFVPDVKSYAILLEGYGEERNFLWIDELFREMKGAGLEPDTVTYGILINAYCKGKRHADAIALYNEMERIGKEPTQHIYTTLIHALGSNGRLNEAIEYFKVCTRKISRVEAPTYTALVTAYCWSGRLHNAYQIVDEMKVCGVGPETRTYDVILHHLVKTGKNEEAWHIFEQMGSSCEAGVSTYDIIVRMFCNEGKVEMALEVWHRMKGRGVVPGLQMFEALIDCLCNNGRVEETCGCVQEMIGMGMRPSPHMFRNLKRFLVNAGREEFVIMLANEIERMRRKARLVRR